MLKTLLFLAANIINTSSSYDRTINAPFRLERVTASYDKDAINVIIDYYINTHQATEIYLSANSYSQQDILSATKSRKSLRQIKLQLPNDGENNTLDLNFNAIWSQEYNMDGTYYFPNGEVDQHTIDEPGEYRYKITKEISFTNRTKNFSYKYDYIDLNIIPKKINTYTNFDEIINISNENTRTKIAIQRNKENIFDDSLENLAPHYIVYPGAYTSLTNIIFKNGGVSKRILLNYDWNVQKQYKGECETSYICILNDKISGNLEEVVSTFVIL